MIQNAGTESTAMNGTRERTAESPGRTHGTGGFLHPERVVERFGLRPGMVVADFGCGSGYFAIPAARKVGESGKVWAIDIQRGALELVASRAHLERLYHVEPIWADLELPPGSRLPNGAADFVIISNILFQVEKKAEVLREAWRVLRTGGGAAILEWDEAPFPAGPPLVLRVPKRTALKLAGEAGFALDEEFSAGDHHYGLLLKKQ